METSNLEKTLIKRSGAHVNSYLLLKQNDKVLLHLRKNTGYCDGMWSLVAVNVEEDESATEGMIRVDYTAAALSMIAKGEFYSELGWRS